jgi:hypothetical protein
VRAFSARALDKLARGTTPRGYLPADSHGGYGAGIGSELRRLTLAHDPEKHVAVCRKDHAQTRIQSAMTIHPNLIAR